MPSSKHRLRAWHLYLLRICLGFLVRVARLRLAPELKLGDESLLPDGIQHPEFQPRRAGNGQYVICNKHLSVFDSQPAPSVHL